MLTRPELKQIARARLADAVALHGRRRYDGAVYVCGYAVELALKARICQTLFWGGYPETRGEFQNYASFRTHDLEVLLHLSGVESRIKTKLKPEWDIVSRWTPESRYDRVDQSSEISTGLMIRFCRTLLQAL